MNEPELRPRGLFIPLELFEDARVSYHDKLLVVLIDMLDHDTRHCFASNAYLAEKLRSTESSVANGLTRLKKTGWVTIANYGKERVLITPLRTNRDRLKAVLKNEKAPSQNGEEEVLNFESVDNKVEFSKLSVSSEEERPALLIFRDHFPDYLPNVYQMDQIETLVTDIPRWETTIKFWKGNGYQARHVDRLIDCYNNGNALPKDNNGTQGAVVHNDLTSCPICENGTACPYHPK